MYNITADRGVHANWWCSLLPGLQCHEWTPWSTYYWGGSSGKTSLCILKQLLHCLSFISTKLFLSTSLVKVQSSNSGFSENVAYLLVLFRLEFCRIAGFLDKAFFFQRYMVVNYVTGMVCMTDYVTLIQCKKLI